jgi:hypothetical protein
MFAFWFDSAEKGSAFPPNSPILLPFKFADKSESEIPDMQRDFDRPTA